MSIKLRSVTEEMAKLNHAIDADAEKVLNKIQATHARRDVVMGAVHKRLDASKQELDDVNLFIDDLEKLTNGAPTSDDSKKSSDTSEKPAVESQAKVVETTPTAAHDGEPGKSWANGQT